MNTAGRYYIPTKAAATYSWRLEASSIEFSETSLRSRVVYWPTSNQPYLVVYALEPEQRDRHWASASAEGRSANPASNLLGGGLQSEPLILAGARAATLENIDGSRWSGGAVSGSSGVVGSGARTGEFMDLPAGWAQARAAAAEIRIQGDLQFAVWENVVTVHTGTGNETFRSGARGEDSYPSPTGGAWVRERNETLLTIRAKNATLWLDVEEGAVLLAGPHIHVDGRLRADFRSAAGTIERGPQRVEFDREPLRVDGLVALRARNATGPDRMAADLTVRDGVITLPTRSEEPLFAAPIVDGSKGIPWWTWVVAAPVALLAGLVLWARRAVTIEDVEWAVLNGRIGRAHRGARRLIRATPQDPDAIFLYGTVLLVKAKHADLVRDVEPLAMHVARAQRAGIAYLLAVAAYAIGDHRRSRRWAEEAASEPMLRTRLRQDGLLGKEAVAGHPAGYA